MNTDRIKELARKQGKSITYICNLIGRPKYYLNDIAKAEDRKIPDEDLKILAINLETTIEYLKGETDDAQFRLSSMGMKTFPYGNNHSRPVYGHASAGLGVIAEENISTTEPVNPEYDTEDFFWLEVDGDSMSPVINNKDLVLVQKEIPLESGSIMVVLIDDTEGFVKKIAINEDSVTLHSFNPHYPPMVFGGSDIGRLRFVGKVIEMKRKF